MNNVFARFGALMMIVLPVAMGITLWHDAHHPELWGDWKHNPHVYVLPCVLTAIPILVYVAFVLRSVWRLHRQIKQRTAYSDYLRKLNGK